MKFLLFILFSSTAHALSIFRSSPIRVPISHPVESVPISHPISEPISQPVSEASVPVNDPNTSTSSSSSSGARPVFIPNSQPMGTGNDPSTNAAPFNPSTSSGNSSGASGNGNGTNSNGSTTAAASYGETKGASCKLLGVGLLVIAVTW